MVHGRHVGVATLGQGLFHATVIDGVVRLARTTDQLGPVYEFVDEPVVPYKPPKPEKKTPAEGGAES